MAKKKMVRALPIKINKKSSIDWRNLTTWFYAVSLLSVILIGTYTLTVREISIQDYEMVESMRQSTPELSPIIRQALQNDQKIDQVEFDMILEEHKAIRKRSIFDNFWRGRQN